MGRCSGGMALQPLMARCKPRGDGSSAAVTSSRRSRPPSLRGRQTRWGRDCGGALSGRLRRGSAEGNGKRARRLRGLAPERLLAARGAGETACRLRTAASATMGSDAKLACGGEEPAGRSRDGVPGYAKRRELDTFMDAKERRKVPGFVRILALICVRQSMLETLHRGSTPITRTGDYSDVFVVDADGRRIPWPEVSRFDEDEMRDLMREIVNKLYTFSERPRTRISWRGPNSCGRRATTGTDRRSTKS